MTVTTSACPECGQPVSERYERVMADRSGDFECPDCKTGVNTY